MNWIKIFVLRVAINLIKIKMKWIKIIEHRVAIVRVIGFLVIAFVATLFIKSLYESNDNAEIVKKTNQETKFLDSTMKVLTRDSLLIVNDTTQRKVNYSPKIK